MKRKFDMLSRRCCFDFPTAHSYKYMTISKIRNINFEPGFKIKTVPCTFTHLIHYADLYFKAVPILTE